MKIENEIEGLSYPSECSNLLARHKELVQEYTNVKFSHLFYYCLSNSGLKTL